VTENVVFSASASHAPVPPPSRVARLVIAGLLDTLFVVLTLYIGWAIWALITMRQGATPGKKLLKMKVVDKDTGVTIPWAKYVFLRGLVGGLILCIPLAGLVLQFMPLWDRRNQSVYGKVSNTIVVDAG
jgi:uncharacterized RDD family membrane protein YckC